MVLFGIHQDLEIRRSDGTAYVCGIFSILLGHDTCLPLALVIILVYILCFMPSLLMTALLARQPSRPHYRRNIEAAQFFLIFLVSKFFSVLRIGQMFEI